MLLKKTSKFGVSCQRQINVNRCSAVHKNIIGLRGLRGFLFAACGIHPLNPMIKKSPVGTKPL